MFEKFISALNQKNYTFNTQVFHENQDLHLQVLHRDSESEDH